jgi:hypothetical protein
MVVIAASLSALAVARTDRVRGVWAVGTGHGSAGEEKGGEDTGELHDCWSLEWWFERRLMIVVETLRKWMLRIEGNSKPFYIYPE